MTQVSLRSNQYSRTDSAVSTFMRGINKATKLKGDDSSIIDLADKSAENKENKTGITVALEDFSEKFKSFHGQNISNINSKDCKKSIFQNIKEFFGGKSSDNIYETDDGQNILNEKESISQNDIFNAERTKNEGIKYAKEGLKPDEIAQYALNFAQADIGAIETSFELADFDKGSLFNHSSKDGKLNEREIKSYSSNYNEYMGNIELTDLDGETGTFSAKEYASYLMVADGLKQDKDGNVTFDINSIDGKITNEESDIIRTVNNDDLKEQAGIIYSEYFKE